MVYSEMFTNAEDDPDTEDIPKIKVFLVLAQPGIPA